MYTSTLTTPTSIWKCALDHDGKSMFGNFGISPLILRIVNPLVPANQYLIRSVLIAG